MAVVQDDFNKKVLEVANAMDNEVKAATPFAVVARDDTALFNGFYGTVDPLSDSVLKMPRQVDVVTFNATGSAAIVEEGAEVPEIEISEAIRSKSPYKLAARVGYTIEAMLAAPALIGSFINQFRKTGNNAMRNEMVTDFKAIYGVDQTVTGSLSLATLRSAARKIKAQYEGESSELFFIGSAADIDALVLEYEAKHAGSDIAANIGLEGVIAKIYGVNLHPDNKLADGEGYLIFKDTVSHAFLIDTDLVTQTDATHLTAVTAAYTFAVSYVNDATGGLVITFEDADEPVVDPETGA